MTGLPTSLAGMAGFIIFVVFILVLIVPNLNNQDAENVKIAQDNFQSRINSTVNSSTMPSAPSGFWGFIGVASGLNGIYDFIVGIFQIVISSVILLFTYLGIFVTVSSSLPAIFYVIFAIMISSIIIGIVKLVFLNGE